MAETMAEINFYCIVPAQARRLEKRAADLLKNPPIDEAENNDE